MGALEWASHCDLRAAIGVCAIRWLTESSSPRSSSWDPQCPGPRRSCRAQC